MGHDKRVNWHGYLLNDYKGLSGVYALYDNCDNLIYIGETFDLRSRMIGHLSSSQFKTLIETIVFYETDFLDRREVEFIMIDICKPKYNFANRHLKMESRKIVLKKNRSLPEYKCTCKVCKGV